MHTFIFKCLAHDAQVPVFEMGPNEPSWAILGAIFFRLNDSYIYPNMCAKCGRDLTRRKGGTYRDTKGCLVNIFNCHDSYHVVGSKLSIFLHLPVVHASSGESRVIVDVHIAKVVD